MKGLFLPEITTEDFRDGCLESIEALIGEGEIYDIDYSEPCEDAISRQAVLDAMYALCNTGETLKENPWRDNPHIDAITDAIDDLPPVNPQPKTGHWEQYGNYWEDKFKCSECGKEQPKILCGERIIGYWSDYCPNCGAKMIEPQESEEV